MPTAKVFDLIYDTIDIMTTSQCSFTAYDITQMVREQTDEEFLHDEVKSCIHSYMDTLVLGGSYIKGKDSKHNAIRYNVVKKDGDELASAPDKAKTAFRLRDVPIFISNNIKRIAKKLHKPQKSIQSIQSIQVSVPEKPQPISYINTRIYNRDNRNRLCIPTNIVAKAGFAKYDAVYLVNSPNPNIGHLVDEPRKDEKILKTLSVDKSGNIRISLETLKKINIDTTDVVDIGIMTPMDAKVITISKHANN